MKKVLLIGATGYIGEVFTQLLYKNEEIQCMYVPHWKLMFPKDLDDQERWDEPKIMDLLYEIDPEIVINAAGYIGKPNVDVCEDNKEATYKGNVLLPKALAKCCQAANVPLMQISSGCIYTGINEVKIDGKIIKKGFSEKDLPNFGLHVGSYYSSTKANAESIVQNLCDKHYILRLRIPFDKYHSPRNYLSKLQTYDKLLEARNSMTHRYEFVQACIELWLSKAPYGIYNIVNNGTITTSEVVELIKKYLQPEKDFKFWESEEEFYRIGAKAPRSNCILDNSKLIDAGIKMRPIDEAIEQSLRYWTLLDQ